MRTTVSSPIYNNQKGPKRIKIIRRTTLGTLSESNTTRLAGTPRGGRQMDAESAPASTSPHLFPYNTQIPPAKATTPKAPKTPRATISDTFRDVSGALRCRSVAARRNTGKKAKPPAMVSRTPTNIRFHFFSVHHPLLFVPLNRPDITLLCGAVYCNITAIALSTQPRLLLHRPLSWGQEKWD